MKKPKTFLRGKTIYVDMRAFSVPKRRMIARDPDVPGWPNHGRKAATLEEAEGYRDAYLAWGLKGGHADAAKLTSAVEGYLHTLARRSCGRRGR